jgi:guanidinopropionase
MGISTFFRAPIADNIFDVDIGLIGIPFDGAVSNRPGTRHGPRAIREQSSMLRAINSATKNQPFKNLYIADLGDIFIESTFDLVSAHNEIEKYFDSILIKNIIPIAIGGDHSISLPILRAMRKTIDKPLALIHIDAHCDTGYGDTYSYAKFTHGSPFYHATEEGLINPHKTIQIGIRGTLNDINQWNYSYDSGMRVVTIDEFYELGWKEISNICSDLIDKDYPTYLSFDIDSIDPSEAPGTGTPEAGGITVKEAIWFLRSLNRHNFIGADLVEVAPQWDPSYLTAFNAASILFEILCLVSKGKKI